MTSDAAELFEHAPFGYAVLDGSGLIVDANLELLRLLGRAKDDVVGHRTLPSLVSVGGRIFFDTHIFPILAMGQTVHEVALDLVGADGTRIPVLLNANVAPDLDPSRMRVRAALFEAKDRRRYETDLLEAVRATEEARRVASELAETLQQTLIPPTPARIEGLEIAAAYRPAGDGSEVGGDFYDVFQVGEHEWVLTIGDVLGKGVAAAVVTTFVRHTVRDLAMQEPDPARLLARLDQALSAHPTDRFCTLVVARLTREDDDWVLVASSGGHPLPLLRRPDGTTTELGQHGSLVGVLAAPSFVSFRHVLSDDVLVFFTDGVIEARRDRVLYGDERLTELVADGEDDVHRLTESIVESVLTYQNGIAEDDIAVLAIRRSRG